MRIIGGFAQFLAANFKRGCHNVHNGPEEVGEKERDDEWYEHIPALVQDKNDGNPREDEKRSHDQVVGMLLQSAIGRGWRSLWPVPPCG
jgi:hypothetical protein